MLIKRAAFSIAIGLAITAISFAIIGDWMPYRFAFWSIANTAIVAALDAISRRL